MKHLVIFHTFSGVMALERFMKKKGIKYTTLPAPRALSVDCGVAVSFEGDYRIIVDEGPTTNIHRIYQEDTSAIVYEND